MGTTYSHRTCTVKNCKGKCHRHPRYCMTHLYRLKKWGTFREDLPVNYLKHGLTKTSEYRSWAMMKNRCLNPKADDYKYYGGRGIKLCKRWYVFQTFLKDMGQKPDPSYTIERKDFNKPYRLSNCIWATRKQQRRNNSNCKLNLKKVSQIKKLAFEGHQQWAIADAFGISLSTVTNVLRGKTWL